MQIHDQLYTYQHNLYPDRRGRFGSFGGKFVPESLMLALTELEAAYEEARYDPDFQVQLQRLLSSFVGRPTTLHYVPRFSRMVGQDVKVYLKREDLAHTGAHKINNALGQGLLARRMGKERIIAETGAG
jgi:tryptophan synthase beta chain